MSNYVKKTGHFKLIRICFFLRHYILGTNKVCRIVVSNVFKPFFGLKLSKHKNWTFKLS